MNGLEDDGMDPMMDAPKPKKKKVPAGILKRQQEAEKKKKEKLEKKMKEEGKMEESESPEVTAEV